MSQILIALSVWLHALGTIVLDRPLSFALDYLSARANEI